MDDPPSDYALIDSVLLQKVRVKGFEPETAARNIIKRKEKVRVELLKVLRANSVDLEALKIACQKTDYLSVDITFYLYSKSTATGRSNKDLDNMLKVICDSLPEHMVHQDTANLYPGLGLIEGDKDEKIFEILSRKKLVNSEDERGFELEIRSYDESKVLN
jgi:hypothetical protein